MLLDFEAKLLDYELLDYEAAEILKVGASTTIENAIQRYSVRNLHMSKISTC